ncbi:MAG: GCN5-related N-acetyltransferase [Pedosphaera sp.]|nr:GCN5-related N-acetyltransferase [Pedosphaera sp.]
MHVPHEQNEPITVDLKDGTRALLRPVIPEDKSRITNGLVQMTPHSRYLRFFTPTAKLTAEQLRYFTEVDQENHVAWIAVDPSALGQPALGIARFVRLNGNQPLAEMALTVIDAYQHKGLGNYLLAVLYLMAREREIQVLRAVILPENRSVSDWFQKLGGTGTFAEGAYQVDLPVHPELALIPGRFEGKKFRRLLEELEEKRWK